MTPAATVATRMGMRAGEAWRTARTPVRNPFRHPAMQSLASLWRHGFMVAVTGDDPQRRRTR